MRDIALATSMSVFFKPAFSAISLAISLAADTSIPLRICARETSSAGAANHRLIASSRKFLYFALRRIGDNCSVADISSMLSIGRKPVSST